MRRWIRRRIRGDGLVSRLALALVLLLACQGNARPAPTLDWVIGDWHGVRRDGTSADEALMVVHVTPLRDGPGHVERLEVKTDGPPYIGFAVRTPSGEDGRWTMIYANSTRETFSHLEGEIEEGRATWRSVTQGRTREYQIVMERLDANNWTRTNRISEDGGRTWRVLFKDELERKE